MKSTSAPTELLGSGAFAELLDTVSGSYEYIILDSSPVNIVADTALISELADGVIIVVRSNRTEKDSVAQAVSSLRLVNAKILGFIFNAAESDGKSGYKYGGYYAAADGEKAGNGENE